MVAADVVARLGAEFLLNKYSVIVDGKHVVVAQFEDAELVLTPEGLELAAAAPQQKTARARKPAAVESAPEAPAEAPAEAPSAPDAAPTE